MNLKEYPDKLHNFDDKLHKKDPIFLMEPWMTIAIRID